jgi:hypothetical protein
VLENSKSKTVQNRLISYEVTKVTMLECVVREVLSKERMSELYIVNTLIHQICSFYIVSTKAFCLIVLGRRKIMWEKPTFV